jgi:hypothetical protein
VRSDLRKRKSDWLFAAARSMRNATDADFREWRRNR